MQGTDLQQKEKGYITVAEFIELYGIRSVKFLKKIEGLPEGSGIRIFPFVSLTDGKYRFEPDVEELPQLQIQFGFPSSWTGLAAAYNTVLTYTITNLRGFLQTIAYVSDQPGVTQWRVTITYPDGTAVILFQDQEIQTAFSQTWADNNGKGFEYQQGTTILIEARSDGIVNVIATASILGTEEE